MGSITTAAPTSAKGELAQALHNYTNTSGNLFKAALIKGTPTGVYGAASVNYSDITGNSDEVASAGYTAGGYAWTAANLITPQIGGTTAFWSWSVNPTWSGVTFITAGTMFYNATSGNRAVYVGSFGGSQSISAATFTLILPTNSSTLAILRLG